MPKKSAPQSPTSFAATVPQSAPSYAEFTDFGRETIAAAINTNAALTDGLEKIGQEVALYARESFANAGETACGLLGARTFEDLVRLQTDFAKRHFDALLARTAKLSELGYAVFGASADTWVRAKTPTP